MPPYQQQLGHKAGLLHGFVLLTLDLDNLWTQQKSRLYLTKSLRLGPDGQLVMLAFPTFGSARPGGSGGGVVGSRL